MPYVLPVAGQGGVVNGNGKAARGSGWYLDADGRQPRARGHAGPSYPPSGRRRYQCGGQSGAHQGVAYIGEAAADAFVHDTPKGGWHMAAKVSLDSFETCEKLVLTVLRE